MCAWDSQCKTHAFGQMGFFSPERVSNEISLKTQSVPYLNPSKPPKTSEVFASASSIKLGLWNQLPPNLVVGVAISNKQLIHYVGFRWFSKHWIGQLYQVFEGILEGDPVAELPTLTDFRCLWQFFRQELWGAILQRLNQMFVKTLLDWKSKTREARGMWMFP